MGYYPQSFNKMCEKRLKLVENNISNKILELKSEGINLRFLKYKDNLDPKNVITKKIIIILQDLDFNEIGEVKYSSFIRKGCTCQSRINANRRIPRITESEAISNINNKIRDTKFIFLGFLDNKWLGYNTSLLFKDTGSQETYSIKYSYFIKNGICSKGGNKIEFIRVGGRGTYYCPKCQRIN